MWGDGLLDTGTFVATTVSDLKAGYEGQSGERAKIAVREAWGGVLFLDEATALLPTRAGKTTTVLLLHCPATI